MNVKPSHKTSLASHLYFSSRLISTTFLTLESPRHGPEQYPSVRPEVLRMDSGHPFPQETPFRKEPCVYPFPQTSPHRIRTDKRSSCPESTSSCNGSYFFVFLLKRWLRSRHFVLSSVERDENLLLRKETSSGCSKQILGLWFLLSRLVVLPTPFKIFKIYTVIIFWSKIMISMKSWNHVLTKN